MKICFPARKHNGENYATLDEMMGLIGREPHGSWLAGTNMLWHGGIHISTVCAPGSILNGDAAVPLQCMAGGEVVAWRLNQDYLTSTYNHQTLQYSSTFVLVKSTCKPDPDKTNSWLDFYSLYLGLAPLSAFTKYKCYKTLTGGVSKRKASAYESSVPAGQVVEAPQTEGTLAKDSRVIILQEAQFLNKDETHKVVAQPFGLAKLLDSEGKAGDKTFWVTLLPQYMAEDGEQYAHLPVWMQHAVAQGTFDAVVKPATALELAAGDAVGFLAKDIDPAGRGTVDTSYFSHVEVLCADPRMPGFLNNPAGIKTGAQYVRIPSGKSLYSKRGEGEDSTFTAMSCVIVKDSGKILPVDKCHPLKDKQGKTWYEISAGSWMSQDDVELLHQYDLKELGFTALEEESTADMTKSLHEGWMKSAFSWLAEQVRPEKGIQQQQVSGYYKKAMKNIDTDGNGKLSGEELFHAVHHPEMEVRNIAARMVVKHDSEWFGGSKHHKWAVYLQNYDRLRLDYTRKWMDDMEWMSQVAPFNEDKPVWHMHPVMFLGAIDDGHTHKRRDYNLGTLSSNYETGGRGSQTVSGGVGDAGGVSYGSYQMTSQTTTKSHGVVRVIIGGTVKIFVSDSSFKWRSEFNGLTPGTSGFTSKWVELVSAHTNEFKEVEHQFIKETHFDKLVAHTLASTNVDVRYHSHTLNDVVWSTAVHHGPMNNVIINAIKKITIEPSEDKTYDEMLINAIYDERGRKKIDGNLVYFSRNSSAVQAGVSSRFVQEKRDALERLKNETDY